MFTTEEIIAATKARIPTRGVAGVQKSLSFKGVSQNSKTIQAGELFIAIRGERFDGHNFLEDVFKKGIKGAVVEKGRYAPDEFPTQTLFEVSNTIEALGHLANFHRQRFSIPIIAITGSNGKTTTKDLISHILQTQFKVLKTEGNFNNLIGLPFTLFKLNKTHEAAVLEMGMSYSFEIQKLCEIAAPRFGLITNIGSAHLASMKSKEKIAKAKGALFEAIPKHGISFINMDDPYLKSYQNKLSCVTKTYSMCNASTDVFGKIIKDHGLNGLSIRCYFGSPLKKSFTFRLPLAGAHNAMNALAAVAVSLSFGLKPSHIKKALCTFKATSGRSRIFYLGEGSPRGGITLIDDSYNANPNSMEAGIKMLKNIANKRTTYAVLGDMLELGLKAGQFHRQIGEIIKENKIDNLLTFGLLSRYIVKEAQKSKKIFTFWTLNQEKLITTLQQKLKQEPGVILVKGSHSMRMDKVVLALREWSQTRG